MVVGNGLEIFIVLISVEKREGMRGDEKVPRRGYGFSTFAVWAQLRLLT